MTAQDHARDCAKRILIYLNLEATERRVAKIQGLVADHMERYKPETVKVVVREKVVYQKEYRKIIVDAKSPLNVMLSAAEDVCKRYNITLEQLKRDSDEYGEYKRKSYQLVKARQVFVKMVRMYDVSFTTIRDFLGYKNHTSVIHLARAGQVGYRKNYNVNG